MFGHYTRDTIAKPGADQMNVTLRLLGYARRQNNFQRCLDIGCGRGPGGSRRCRLQELFALDMDMASLVLAQKYCQEHGLTNIRFFKRLIQRPALCRKLFRFGQFPGGAGTCGNQQKTMQESSGYWFRRVFYRRLGQYLQSVYPRTARKYPADRLPAQILGT